MNPHLTKLQADARTAFRQTKLGKLLTETHKEVTSGRATVKTLMQRGAAMRQITSVDATRDLMQQMGLGNSWTMIERYAGKEAWRNIVKDLPTIGKILKSLSEGKPKEGQPVPHIAEEEAAANLLRAFGWTVNPPIKNKPIEFASIDPAVQAQVIEQEARRHGIEISPRRKALPGWPQTRITQPAGEQGPLLPQMEMIPVQSSNVHSIGFRYETAAIGTLLVRFLSVGAGGSRSGPGSLYEYFNVPSILFERFKQAGSKGGFVWDNLRIRGTVSGHKFNYDLAGITGGYVPRRAQLKYFLGPRGGRRATEAFVPRAFNVGEIRKGRMQMRRIQSQLPEQHIGRSFAVRTRGRK